MEYMGNVHWWNERFLNREKVLMQPEECLKEDVKSYFPSEGNILDAACGDGRNAIYLAEAGYMVHAIDFSEKALDRLKDFALLGRELLYQKKQYENELGKFVRYLWKK